MSGLRRLGDVALNRFLYSGAVQSPYYPCVCVHSPCKRGPQYTASRPHSIRGLFGHRVSQGPRMSITPWKMWI